MGLRLKFLNVAGFSRLAAHVSFLEGACVNNGPLVKNLVLMEAFYWQLRTGSQLFDHFWG